MKKIECMSVNPLLGSEIPFPVYATVGSAGLDLRACISEPVILPAGETVLIPTGLAVNIRDASLFGMVVPRSGLSMKHGIGLKNMVGIIDSDYQGEIKVPCWNHGRKDYVIQPGERLFQLLFVPVEQVDLQVVSGFSGKTKRGQGGFGHTGTK